MNGRRRNDLTRQLHVILKCFGGGLICLAMGNLIVNPVGSIWLALGLWLCAYAAACYAAMFGVPLVRRFVGPAYVPESLEVRRYAARQAMGED